MKKFRKNMLKNYGLKNITHFDDNKFFIGCDIKGGVSYFLLDKKYVGNIYFNKNILKLDGIDIIPNLLDKSVFSIINKISKTNNIVDIFNSQGFFNVKTNDKNFISEKLENYIKCYVSKQKGYIKYYPINKLKNQDKINKIKVALPSASGKGGMGQNFYNRIEIIQNGDICSESFIFFDFDDNIHANNFKKFLETKFVSFLVRLRKIKQHVTSDIFRWTPKLDFSRSWTDEELYEYFNLTQEEIDLIEKTIKL